MAPGPHKGIELDKAESEDRQSWFDRPPTPVERRCLALAGVSIILAALLVALVVAVATGTALDAIFALIAWGVLTLLAGISLAVVALLRTHH